MIDIMIVPSTATKVEQYSRVLLFQLTLLERMRGIPIFSTTKSHFASALLSVIPSGGSGYQGDEKEI